jgi:hypothetical protein
MPKAKKLDKRLMTLDRRERQIIALSLSNLLVSHVKYKADGVLVSDEEIQLFESFTTSLKEYADA